MTKLTLLLFLQLVTLHGIAQLNESFSDGNFTSNPAWSGNAADWTVNSSNQLQSNNTVANSSYYLCTPSAMATQTQWEFFAHLAFNTSSANYVDVYLTASAADISAITTTGYFVRIGNTADEVSLYRKDANGTSTKLIDGVDGITNTSDNTLKIKVTRNAGNVFTLYRDVAGTGASYISEGTATDAAFTTSGWFGIFVKQSTASFFQKHYFDDIQIQAYTPDITPPAIQNITAISPTSIDVLYSESVDLTSSQTLVNYSVNNGIGNPATAQRDASNTALVHLTFGNVFSNGVIHTLAVNNVEDLVGNALINGTGTFSFYTAQRYDVVIDEILADPTPSVGLPNAEYIELKNTSGRNLTLTGWRIASATTTSAAFPSYTLPADSFLILTSTGNAALFTSVTKVLGVPGFPSLDNDGAMLTLTSKEGLSIHAVSYNKSWHSNSVKVDGGWSLEMIDTHYPCGGASNWKSSTDASGGTPGRKNSADDVVADQAPPQLLRTYTMDSVTIVAVFDEPLDSVSATFPNAYTISNGLSVAAAFPQPPLFNEVVLKLTTPLAKRTVYTITVTGIKDCKGNTATGSNKAKAGLPEEVVSTDLVINEILFDPRPNASDYIEFYNRSTKVVDASRLLVANRNSSSAVSSVKQLSETPFLLFPEDYVVATEDAAALQREYLVKNPGSVFTLSSLPSYPDDKGNVILLNLQGDIIDEVAYSSKWHFALLSNPEGVSLERVDPAGVSQDARNWHSAASTVGYATPTYKNSQYKQTGSSNAVIEVSPKVFSPDNDGRDDIATIEYTVDKPGYVANITIFDASGRAVRYLVRNGTLGLKGQWTWDGLGEKGTKLLIGTYIIYTELFNLDGEKKVYKTALVLARQLK